MPSRFWLFSPSASYVSAQGTAWFSRKLRTQSWTAVGRLSLRPSPHNRSSAPTILVRSVLRKSKNSSFLRREQNHKNDQDRNLQWIEKHTKLTTKQMKKFCVRDVETDRAVCSLDLAHQG